MKKISLLLIGMILSSILFTYSQENVQDQNDAEKEKRYNGQVATEVFTKKDYSHWSLYVDFGLNSFFGDMEPDAAETFKKPLDHWNAGAGIEYTINPVFSIGLGYTFHRIAASDEGGSFKSNVHNVYPYFGFNPLNYPIFKRNNKWDLWFTLGLGYAYYTPELSYVFEGRVNHPDYPTQESWEDGAGNVELEKGTIVMPVGLELSYDITRQFAIALKAQYFMYTHDNLEGAKSKLKELGDDRYGRKNYTYSGVTNDHTGNVNLALRWNFAKKEKTHMRKVSWDNYATEPQIREIVRDTCCNVTPVVVCECEADCPIEPVIIYFDFDKYDLTPAALIEITKAARILQENKNLDVEITGFTDIKGSNPYNDKLSERRADVTKNELVNIWNIDPARITAKGKGKATAPRPELEEYHGVNRRCEFRFYKRAE